MLMEQKNSNTVQKEVKEIRTDKNVYVFDKVQTLLVTRKEGHWVLNVEKYDIYCCGDSVDEVLQEYAENIIVAWKLYVECPESELTEDAKKLRKILESDLRKYDCIPK